jgi:hypothetical protein
VEVPWQYRREGVHDYERVAVMTMRVSWTSVMMSSSCMEVGGWLVGGLSESSDAHIPVLILIVVVFGAVSDTVAWHGEAREKERRVE